VIVDIKEAIKILAGQELYYNQDKQFEAECKARRIAVRSLEAWEKVVEEIEETDFTELLILSGDVEVIKIGILNTIKNNLKEVSE